MAKATKYTLSLCGPFTHERDTVGVGSKPLGRTQGLAHERVSYLSNDIWIKWALGCGDGPKASPAALSNQNTLSQAHLATLALLVLMLLTLPSSVPFCGSSVPALHVPKTRSTPQGDRDFALTHLPYSSLVLLGDPCQVYHSGSPSCLSDQSSDPSDLFPAKATGP